MRLVLCRFGRTLKTLDTRRFWEVYAKGTHVHAVEEGAEALVEAVQALVQQLQVHEVGFQVGHAVSELAKRRLEGFEGQGGVGEGGCGCGGGRGAQAGAGRGSQGGGGSRGEVVAGAGG